MMFAAMVGRCFGRASALPTQRPTMAIDGDSLRGNHLSEPKRCSDQPGHHYRLVDWDAYPVLRFTEVR